MLQTINWEIWFNLWLLHNFVMKPEWSQITCHAKSKFVIFKPNWNTATASIQFFIYFIFIFYFCFIFGVLLLLFVVVDCFWSLRYSNRKFTTKRKKKQKTFLNQFIDTTFGIFLYTTIQTEIINREREIGYISREWLTCISKDLNLSIFNHSICFVGH